MRITRATPRQATACVRGYRRIWGQGDLCPGISWWVLDGSAENGFCGAYVTADGVTVYMTAAYVAPEYRGRGAQLRMLRARMAWGRTRGCEKARTYTWTSNIQSQRSLARVGFLPVKLYTRKDGAWLVFERPLR